MEYETPGMLIRQVDDITVVRLRNPNITDAQELTHIAAEVDGLLERGVRKLVLDFKYVRFIGSAALGLLIRLQKRVTLAGGRMVISHPEHITELLRVSHTACLFTLAVDLSDARKRFEHSN